MNKEQVQFWEEDFDFWGSSSGWSCGIGKSVDDLWKVRERSLGGRGGGPKRKLIFHWLILRKRIQFVWKLVAANLEVVSCQMAVSREYRPPPSFLEKNMIL